MVATSHRRACEAARNLGRRVAAAGACLAALVSLLQHAPAWLACLHGAATLLVLSLGARLGSAALARAMAFDRRFARKQEAKS